MKTRYEIKTKRVGVWPLRKVTYWVQIITQGKTIELIDSVGPFRTSYLARVFIGVEEKLNEGSGQLPTSWFRSRFYAASRPRRPLRQRAARA